MSAAPYTILVIPGDGIGREVIPAAVAVLRATGLPFHFENADAGWECFQRQGEALPPATLAAARTADAILFGAVASPGYPVAGYRSPIVRLRRELDLYANIRPVFDDLPENGGAPSGGRSISSWCARIRKMCTPDANGSRTMERLRLPSVSSPGAPARASCASPATLRAPGAARAADQTRRQER